MNEKYKRFKDETGNKYGKLLVLKREENSKFGTTRWLCQCDCGNIKIILGESLRKGATKSCGCISGGRKRSGLSPLKRLYSSVKIGAQKRNLKFSISFDNFCLLAKKSCFYCGKEPYIEHFAYHRTRYSKGKSFDESGLFNGIDRLNNSLGYEKENCVSCCKICNSMKSDLSLEKFYEKITEIYLNKDFKKL
jgi:hypothetical protein